MKRSTYEFGSLAITYYVVIFSLCFIPIIQFIAIPAMFWIGVVIPISYFFTKKD